MLTEHTTLLLDIVPAKRSETSKKYSQEHSTKPIITYLQSTGITVLRLTATKYLTTADLHNAINIADSVLLPGGEDITPTFYGGNKTYQGSGIHTYSGDKHQIEAVRYATRQNKKVFGICRGLQIINVAYGGTLLQHIEGHINPDITKETHQRFHKTELITGDPQLSNFTTVGCLHHQAINKLGEGLTATSYAHDGIIESVKHENGLVKAYQFHPEAPEHLTQQLPTVAEFLTSRVLTQPPAEQTVTEPCPADNI